MRTWQIRYMLPHELTVCNKGYYNVQEANIALLQTRLYYHAVILCMNET